MHENMIIRCILYRAKTTIAKKSEVFKVIFFFADVGFAAGWFGSGGPGHGGSSTHTSGTKNRKKLKGSLSKVFNLPQDTRRCPLPLYGR
jgi:hypothetical protein